MSDPVPHDAVGLNEEAWRLYVATQLQALKLAADRLEDMLEKQAKLVARLVESTEDTGDMIRKISGKRFQG